MLLLAKEDGTVYNWALEITTEDVFEGSGADYLLRCDQREFGPLAKDISCDPI